MVTGSNYTCHGEHLEMYKIDESLGCSSEPNKISYVNCIPIKWFTICEKKRKKRSNWLIERSWIQMTVSYMKWLAREHYSHTASVWVFIGIMGRGCLQEQESDAGRWAAPSVFPALLQLCVVLSQKHWSGHYAHTLPTPCQAFQGSPGVLCPSQTACWKDPTFHGNAWELMSPSCSAIGWGNPKDSMTLMQTQRLTWGFFF